MDRQPPLMFFFVFFLSSRLWRFDVLVRFSHPVTPTNCRGPSCFHVHFLPSYNSLGELVSPAQICMSVCADSSQQLTSKVFVFILVAHTHTHARSYCISRAQYPVGVDNVVAGILAIGAERRRGPLVHGCSKAWCPLVAVWAKCILRQCWLCLEMFVVQWKYNGLLELRFGQRAKDSLGLKCSIGCKVLTFS